MARIRLTKGKISGPSKRSKHNLLPNSPACPMTPYGFLRGYVTTCVTSRHNTIDNPCPTSLGSRDSSGYERIFTHAAAIICAPGATMQESLKSKAIKTHMEKEKRNALKKLLRLNQSFDDGGVEHGDNGRLNVPLNSSKQPQRRNKSRGADDAYKPWREPTTAATSAIAMVRRPHVARATPRWPRRT